MSRSDAEVLDDMGRRDAARAAYAEAAGVLRAKVKELRGALDKCWRGDRYLRAYADSGKEVTPIMGSYGIGVSRIVGDDPLSR